MCNNQGIGHDYCTREEGNKFEWLDVEKERSIGNDVSGNDCGDATVVGTEGIQDDVSGSGRGGATGIVTEATQDSAEKVLEEEVEAGTHDEVDTKEARIRKPPQWLKDYIYGN